jgi:hypothetical protein
MTWIGAPAALTFGMIVSVPGMAPLPHSSLQAGLLDGPPDTCDAVLR